MADSKSLTFHLLPNAHLDPVWLWDWREGLNEGRITVATILDLMDEFPDLTFMRGESSIYEHIEKVDPKLFHRIRQRIDDGRWDVIGGTVVQPDTNLASTETLCREFEIGLEYFDKHLGARPTIAWQADSFGHTPALPDILAAFGMTGFAFTRPQQAQFPLDSAPFWWKGASPTRLLCYRQHWLWYCSERENMKTILDETLAGAKSAPFKNAAVLFGLGNHGGGPTRRHMREILKWNEAHPEVDIRYSTLHGFFDALRGEVDSGIAIPTVHGDLGYCLRGCYSSVQKFKSLYRHAEALTSQADITRSLVGMATGDALPDLAEAWKAITFNAFHDILPGSSIERALDEQMAWTSLAIHRAHETRFAALNQLASNIDATVPPARGADLPTDVPILVWNGLPRDFHGLVELEAPLDYRPIWEYRHRKSEIPVVAFDAEDRPLPLQKIATEHSSMEDVPWRARIVAELSIPAFGWTVVRMGYRNKALAHRGKPAVKTTSGRSTSISDHTWKVAVENGQLRIRKDGANFFTGNRNMEIRVLDDPWGSWGGMLEERKSFNHEDIRETWKLDHHEILEAGPMRAKLFTRWKGKNSWLDLTFSLSNSGSLHVSGRMLLNERSVRVKIAFPMRGDVTYDMPGGAFAREAEGQVPGARWVTRRQGERVSGFASNAFSDFDATASELGVTLARASRYANDTKTRSNERLWLPATDCGELKFQFCLFGAESDPEAIADSLQYAPVATIVPAASGTWKREGSLATLSPESVLKLLSCEQLTERKMRLRVQNLSERVANVKFRLGRAKAVDLGKLPPRAIRIFTLTKSPQGIWRCSSNGIHTPSRSKISSVQRASGIQTRI
jgi:alpha-mannosidase